MQKKLCPFKNSYDRLTRGKQVRLSHLKSFKNFEAYKKFNDAVVGYEAKLGKRISDNLYIKLAKEFSTYDEFYNLVEQKNKNIFIESINEETNIRTNKFEDFFIYSREKKKKKNTSLKKILGGIRFNVTEEQLDFCKDDVDKFHFLCQAIRTTRRKFDYDDEEFIAYIRKFYFCKKFNRLYKLWLKNNKLKQIKPSLDHIIPISQGGTNDLDNLQFITLFENTAKMDCCPKVWKKIRDNIHLFLV